MARRRRVFIDTSELYPFTMMDVLLTMSENFLFTWVWTDELLDEWERVIIRDRQRTPKSARSITDAVRSGFAKSRLDPADYRDRVDDDLSPDPDDRIHVAACLDGRADVLLTRNIKDFPNDMLRARACGSRPPTTSSSISFGAARALCRRRSSPRHRPGGGRP